MVFENVLAFVLEKYLGDYVTNLDTNNLRVALWGGDVELENLKLKSSALAEMNMPLSIKAGFLRKLRLIIPWKNIYSQRVKVEIKGLYILVVPKSEMNYDQKREDDERHEVKMRQIKHVELMRKEQHDMASQSSASSDGQSDTFTERLQMQIIRNLELTVEDIHIRFEDHSTATDSTFSFGLMLNNINLKTTDETWTPTFLSDIKPVVYKIVNIDEFSAYWNSKDVELSHLKPSDIFEKLHDMIPSKTGSCNMDFVLKPMSLDARLKLNVKPQLLNFAEPSQVMDATLKEIDLNFSQPQYKNLLQFMHTQEFLANSYKYARYRSNRNDVSIVRNRWYFAIDAIMEVNVKPRVTCWRWECIHQHRSWTKEYRQLYIRESTTKLSTESIKRMKQLELHLDVFNLTLVRSSARREVDIVLREQNKKKSWTGWVQSFWTASENSEIDLSEEFNEVEKKKLYEAIGYDGDVTSFSTYPKEFIQTMAKFSLDRLSLTLWGAKHSCTEDSSLGKHLLKAVVAGSRIEFSRRPAQNALKFAIHVERMSALGSAEFNETPPVIMSNESDINLGQHPSRVSHDELSSHLLHASFETNPLDAEANFRIIISCSSFGLFYHAKTINDLYKSFMIGRQATHSLASVKVAAYTAFTQAKQRTKLLLQYNLENVKVLDVNIRLRSSYFILPRAGNFEKGCSLFCLDFGDFSLKRNKNETDLPPIPIERPVNDDTISNLQRKSYTRFKMTLSHFQLLFAEEGDDWINARTLENTALHVINPISLSVDLAKCLYDDDDTLPAYHVRGVVPALCFAFSERRFHSALDVLRKIPLPNIKSALKIEPDTDHIDDVMDKTIHQLHDLSQIPLKSDEGATIIDVQLTIAVGEFEVEKIQMSILKQTEGQSTPFLTFLVQGVGCIAKIKTYENSVDAYLSSIDLFHEHFLTDDDRPLPMINTPAATQDDRDPDDDGLHLDDKLINFRLVMADPDCPHFDTKYRNSKLLVETAFAKLGVVLQLEALHSVLAFSDQVTIDLTNFFAEFGKAYVEEIKPSKIQSTPALDRVTKSKSKVDKNVFDFCARASLLQFTLELGSRHSIFMTSVLDGLNIDMQNNPDYTKIDVSLQKFQICDTSTDVLYSKLIGPKSSSSDLAKAVVILRGHQDDLNVPDCEIEAHFSKIECCFLMRNVRGLLLFLDEFQFVRDRVKNASVAYAALSFREMRKLAEMEAFKVKLDIVIDAPVIYIPQNWQSFDCLIVDLGRIYMTTSFSNADQGLTVLEVQDLLMEDVKAGRLVLPPPPPRRRLDHQTNMTVESKAMSLIACERMKVTVKRRLTTPPNSHVPYISTMLDWSRIQMDLSKGDFGFIMKLLSENINDPYKPESSVISIADKYYTKFRTEDIAKEHAEFAATMDQTKLETAIEAAQSSSVYIFSEVAIGVIEMTLYTGASDLESCTRDKKTVLSSSSVRNLNLLYSLLHNENYTVDLSVHDISASDDLNISSKSAHPTAYKLIGRKDVVKNEASMITVHLTCDRQVIKNSNKTKQVMTVVGELEGFYVSSSLEYILSLQDFVMSGLACYNVPDQNDSEKTRLQTQLQPSEVPDNQPVLSGNDQVDVEDQDEMTIRLSINKPEIILKEDMKNPNSNCLVMEMDCNLDTKYFGNHRSVQLALRRLTIYCRAVSVDDNSKIKYQILEPINVSLCGPMTPTSQKLSIDISRIVLIMAPIAIRIAIGVTKALRCSDDSAAEDSIDAEREWEREHLWENLRADDHDPFNISDQEKPSTTVETSSESLIAQEAMITFQGIYFKIEMGSDQLTSPVVICELAGMHIQVVQWSTTMRAYSVMSLEIAAFNEHAGGWEPIVERIEMSDNNESYLSPSTVVVEYHVQPHNNKDTRIASVFFLDGLHVSLTGSTIQLLYKISKCFGEAYAEMMPLRTDAITAKPLQFHNLLGEPVMFRGTSDIVPDELTTSDKDTFVQHNNMIPLLSLSQWESNQSIIRQVLNNTVRQELMVKVRGHNQRINVTRSLPRVFEFEDTGGRVSYVCETTCLAEKRTIVVRGVLKIENHSKMELSLLKHFEETTFSLVDNIGSNSSYYPPVSVLFDFDDTLHLLDASTSAQGQFKWREDKNVLLKFQGHGMSTRFLQAWMETREALKDNSYKADSHEYILHLVPPVTLINLLSIAIKVHAEAGSIDVDAGEEFDLTSQDPQSVMNISFKSSIGKEWRGSIPLNTLNRSSRVITFSTTQNEEKHLVIHIENRYGGKKIKLFCPYWIINKTETKLDLRVHGSNDITTVNAGNSDFLLHLPTKEINRAKKEARVKVLSGDWSDRFSMDAIGNTTAIVCKTKDEHVFEIGVDIAVSSYGLTKMITFIPGYTLINQLPFPVYLAEVRLNMQGRKNWFTVEAEQTRAFWPHKTKRKPTYLIARYRGSEPTEPFQYDFEHATLLRLRNGEVNSFVVECCSAVAGAFVSFSDYKPGMAPFRLFNFTKSHELVVCQSETSDAVRVPPGHSTFFTWSSCISDRLIDFSIGGQQVRDMGLQDCQGKCDGSNGTFHYASFIRSSQRMLILTDNLMDVIKYIRVPLPCQPDRLELIMQHLSISLVDDIRRRELVHIFIYGSDTVWYSVRQSALDKHVTNEDLRPIQPELSSQLEHAFESKIDGECSIATSTGTYTVNLDTMTVVNHSNKTCTAVCRRAFNGLLFQALWTDSSVTYHFHIYRLQVDNQMSDVIFPVIFHHVPPKNALPSEVHQPLIVMELEMPMTTTNSAMIHIRKAKFSCQEFAILLDQAVIANFLRFFSIESDAKASECLGSDLKYCSRTLEDILLRSSDSLQQVLYFGKCEISPLKLHFSFSMHSTKSNSVEDLLRQYPSIDFFLQTVNIADVQDCVLRLGYYERNNHKITLSRFIEEVRSHYQKQAMMKIHVLMFGLDALGNPYGLLRGVGQGLESLFYEPYKGSIDGVQGFAEGVAVGARNLFGGVIGGASGVASRITGTVGKGLAQLTFDDEYKSRRLRNMAHANTLPQSIVRSGHGVVKGIYEGLTGLVTQPMEGAKNEGTEGLMKGLGKGFMGLMTRPLGGVIDMASSSFESVKRISTQEMVVNRIRKPRFIDFDGLMRAYRQHESEGNEMLQNLDNKVLSKNDIYACHIQIVADPPSFLFATNRRLMMLITMALFNRNDMPKNITYEELAANPTIVKYSSGEERIEIRTKGEAKSTRTSSGSQPLALRFMNRTDAERFCEKVKGIMQDQGIYFDNTRRRRV